MPPRQRARYGGYFVAAYTVASLIGPVTGGVLAGQREVLGVAGWRWIFLVNLPVESAAFVVVTLHRFLLLSAVLALAGLSVHPKAAWDRP